MEHILDDNTDHLKAREEKLLKRRKVFRVLIFVVAFIGAALTAYINRGNGGWWHQFQIFYLGLLLLGGLIGLMMGYLLSLFMWKDLNTKIRRKYLISISTIGFHSFWAGFLALGFIISFVRKTFGV